MKIMIYGINYSPELTGVGKYSGEMAAWLAKQGHEVRVVTAPPYYPEWKLSEGYSQLSYKQERISDVRVWRCPLYVPRQVSGLKRVLHLASFALSSFPMMLRCVFWKPDVVLVIEPSLLCAPTGWLVARLSGAKCWLHIQDFEIDAAFALGIIPFAWMKKTMSTMECWLMRRFDMVSSISNAMLNRLHAKGVDAPVLFPNWADLSHVVFVPKGRQSFRASLGLGEAETLCLYSGNIAVKQGLEIILEVAQKLPDIVFVICGDGANRSSLASQMKALALSNVIFLPLQPLAGFVDMLSAADIHLVIQKAGACDLVMPSKLTNILAIGGLAIVTAELNSELGLLAEGSEACVYRCDPENADALVQAIEKLKADPEYAQTIAGRAKLYADEHIDMERVLAQFEKRLKKVLAVEMEA